MQQRLAHGDDVTRMPRIPVLLQFMESERIAGPAFSSGVLFTEEPEGRTRGLTKIQATYGPNEAVVGALLPCDSYYVREDGSVREVRRRKPERLLHGTTAFNQGLLRQNNPLALLQGTAIPPAVVQRLHKVGARIAAHYGKPMDIEWTYDPEADKVWLLQARPIVQRSVTEATHLNPDAIRGEPRLTTRVIGAGDGQVKLIGAPSAVVMGRDLDEALRAYLDREDTGAVRAALTAKPSDPTSHEATTFRGESIPVLLARDLESRACGGGPAPLGVRRLRCPPGQRSLSVWKQAQLSGGSVHLGAPEPARGHLAGR